MASIPPEKMGAFIKGMQSRREDVKKQLCQRMDIAVDNVMDGLLKFTGDFLTGQEKSGETVKWTSSSTATATSSQAERNQSLPPMRDSKMTLYSPSTSSSLSISKQSTSDLTRSQITSSPNINAAMSGNKKQRLELNWTAGDGDTTNTSGSSARSVNES